MQVCADCPVPGACLVDRKCAETSFKSLSTKAESLAKTEPTIPKKKVRALEAMKEYGAPLTREELADLTDMALSSICCIANRLIKDGDVVVDGVRYNATTNRNRELLKLAA